MGVIKYKNGLYRSSLGPKLQAFIEAKHNANSPYSSDYFTLHQFDLFVAEFFPNATTISKGSKSPKTPVFIKMADR